MHNLRHAPIVLTPAEVAAMFRVDPKTVTRWANSGKVKSFRTPGGAVRIWADGLEEFLPTGSGGTPPPPEPSRSP